MKANSILMIFVKFVAIFVFTIAVMYILAKLIPPPKGTAFDGLEYVLKPVFVSLISGFIYLLVSLIKPKHEKKLFISALLISFIYSVLLYVHVL